MADVFSISRALLPVKGALLPQVYISRLPNLASPYPFLVYSATKAAVEAVTRVMGAELREKGIRVNSINPGPVETDMFFALPSETQEYFKASLPVAKVEDIADIIVLLAGPKSRWLTGSTVNANNGAIFI